MGLKDLLVTPIFFFLFLFLAHLFRDKFSNQRTRKYFIPALSVRFVAAISLGLIYQFYYGGGDTFSYWTHGSQWIWKAFLDSPLEGLKLIFWKTGINQETYTYAQNIWFFSNPPSYFVVRVAGFLDILTFGTYSTTSLFFALFSFGGSWTLFSTLTAYYPGQESRLKFALLFFPSILFWGSGIMKDTLTLGAFLFLVNGLFVVLKKKRISIFTFITILVSSWVLLSVKAYILYCTIPAVVVWIYSAQIGKIGSKVFKVLFAPLILGFFVLFGHIAVTQATKGDSLYSIDNLAQRAWITAYDIRFYTGKDAGSGYSLGEQDGTWQTMLTLAPAAVNVTLFRPYLWEVRNPFMLIMAFESLILLVLVIRFVALGGYRLVLKDPFLIFSVCFSITFAFAVGVSTYNFGTLMRYKIPMLPIILIPLLLVPLSKRTPK